MSQKNTPYVLFELRVPVYSEGSIMVDVAEKCL